MSKIKLLIRQMVKEALAEAETAPSKPKEKPGTITAPDKPGEKQKPRRPLGNPNVKPKPKALAEDEMIDKIAKRFKSKK